LAHRHQNVDRREVLGGDVPGYWSEVHHVDSWARGGPTNVDNLTLACKPDNDLAEKGWHTRQFTNGRTRWIPPPRLDRGQPRTNDYHHPERYLPGSGE
jgi:HNH endonuclease